MDGFCEPFRSKKITLLGLGLLGRGVGDAAFLAGCGADVVAVDRKSEEELADSVEKLKQYPNIAFHLGTYKLEDFISADMVIKAAGVPPDSPGIAAAKKAGVPVYMSTALFAKYAIEAGAQIVGITGTRGKSTITHMISSSLIRANKRIVVGGNVRGKSTLAMLPEVEAGTTCVLELDSWQLQGFGDLKISPHISVFTNLMPDHQNYYPDMEAYFTDKANIFRFQSRRQRVGTPTEASGKNQQGDALLVGRTILERVQAARPEVAPQVPPAIPADWKLTVIGEHNRENASLAAAALKALDLSEQEIRTGLESFEPVEGRLQLVREINGVKIYNDNNATTQEATVAGLRAVGKSTKNVVLIVGGDDKKLDMSKLVKEIPKWCSKVVLFKELGTNRIRDEIFALEPAVSVFEEEGLEATVHRAFEVAEPGETILYSPAFSSFGKYFKNEFDRGDQFVQLIKKL